MNKVTSHSIYLFSIVYLALYECSRLNCLYSAEQKCKIKHYVTARRLSNVRFYKSPCDSCHIML